MAPVEIQEVDLWGWQGWRLATDRIQLTVAPEVGGRALSLTLDGSEAFFTLDQLHGRRLSLDNVTDVRAEKRRLGWRHYGGYKTWLAPQQQWTDALPFLDLDSGSYSVEINQEPQGSAIHLTSPVCRETGIQLRRSFSINSTGTIAVEQTMTNHSDLPVAWGLWDVTQVSGPGRAVLPLAPNSRFRNGVKAYETEGRSPQVVEQYVARSDGLATITCQQVESFKYGTDSTAGWLLGLLDREPEHWLAYLKVFQAQPNASYPHEAIAEVYDSGDLPYFELEVHSPLQQLAPGDTYSFKETWLLDWLPKISDPAAIRQWVVEAKQAQTTRPER